MKRILRKIYLAIMSFIDRLKLNGDIEDNWHSDSD